MIQCTKCHEVIGDNLSECPFCKHRITEEERKNAIAENERLHQEAINNSVKEYSKRVKLEIGVIVLMIVIAVIGMALMYVFDSMICLIIMFLLDALIYILCVYKLHIGRCPYCESLMGRKRFFISYCSRCGGKIR